jgi:hypothetical protein
MGFLDNSGDIILDAVLTDLGRKRMAEGTFTITQFALSDDEINYGSYNPDHPSGSAYFDLEIIQTPILESFTNNTSTMKSRLLTLDNNANFLYLPVILENSLPFDSKRHASNTFLVAVDRKTQVNREDQDKPDAVGVGRDGNGNRQGVLYGKDPTGANAAIMLHQGINNENMPRNQSLESALVEDTYVIQIDGRFGEIVTTQGQPIGSINTTQDDDGFLFYTVSSDLEEDRTGVVTNLNTQSESVLLGSRGSKVEFKIKASSVLTDNESFFDRYGFSIASGDSDLGTKACKAIDSIIRVTGLKTGFSIDIPVRFIKDVS